MKTRNQMLDVLINHLKNYKNDKFKLIDEVHYLYHKKDLLLCESILLKEILNYEEATTLFSSFTLDSKSKFIKILTSLKIIR